MDINDKVTPLSSEFDYSQVPSWYAICHNESCSLRQDMVFPDCENTVFCRRKQCFPRLLKLQSHGMVEYVCLEEPVELHFEVVAHFGDKGRWHTTRAPVNSQTRN